MTDEEQLAQAVQTIIERHSDLVAISPAWVATAAMQVIEFPRDLHALGYAGCHLELRQMARSKLRRQFDPVTRADDAADYGEDLFPDTLQDRYPRHPRSMCEPEYVQRARMSRDDLDYNVERMRRAGSALLRHADALQEWGASHLGEAA
jgi:hypothetical protein